MTKKSKKARSKTSREVETEPTHVEKEAHAAEAEAEAGPTRALPAAAATTEPSVVDNPLAIAIVLTIVFSVLVGLTWKLGEKLPEAHASDALPADSFLVALAHVPTLRSSALGSVLLGDTTKGALGLSEFERSCGFDPVTRIEELAIAIPEDDAKGAFGVAAKVTISESELATCASKLAESKAFGSSRRVDGTFHVLEAQAANKPALAYRPSGAAGANGGLLLVGEGVWLTKMMRAAEGATPRFALKREGTPMLVAEARLPTSLRERLKRELQGEVGAASDASQIMQSVLSVRAATLRVDAQQAELRAELRLACESQESAEVVAKLIERKRFEAGKDLGLRLIGVGALLDNLEAHALSDQGNPTTLATFHAPAEELSRTLTRALRFRLPAAPSPSGESRTPANPATSARKADEVLRAPKSH